jgi:hypothetical protein
MQHISYDGRLARILSTLSVSVAFATISSLTFPARADRIAPGGNDHGVVSVLGAGVREIGLESQFVLRSESTPSSPAPSEASRSSSLSLVGTPFFRYFVADQIGITIQLGGFLRSASATTGAITREDRDVGFIGTASASYHLGLGGGFFVVPLAGAGYFAGSRELTSRVGDSSTIERASISGPVVRAGVGLVFYPSARVHLFARPEVLGWFSTARSSDGSTQQQPRSAARATIVEGGITCGVAYVF